jgi:DNA-3-methyladenine glycosylase II
MRSVEIYTLFNRFTSLTCVHSSSTTFLTQADPLLGELIQRVGPLTLKPKKSRSIFETLVISIANQQLSGKAAATILQRFRDLYPGQTFPSPEQVLKTKSTVLRSVGFSNPKVSYIQEVAQRTMDGLVPTRTEILKMSDEEIIEKLTEIKGIGRWTVEMLLIFTLGRPDVLPARDLGIQKGFALTYRKRKLPDPDQILRFGKRWAPHRTTAAWYLWRAVDLHQKQRQTTD